MSKIEWTNATWNPVTGCSKVSPGCKHCYAERMAHRLKSMGQLRYRNAFEVTLHKDIVTLPLRWHKPKMIFVNSMSDLFHEDIPLHFIQQVFETMQLASHHIFQVLTKRAERLSNIASSLRWPTNIWIGVSVENSDYLFRIRHLKKVPARVRFLSLEPLLGPLDNLPLSKIDWVIVGGESGPHARPINPEWIRRIRMQCLSQRVPFFFKQWGGRNKRSTGRELDGRTWDELPLAL